MASSMQADADRRAADRQARNMTYLSPLGALSLPDPARRRAPLGLAVERADRNGLNVVKATLESIPVRRPAPGWRRPQGMCPDEGHDGNRAGELVDEVGYMAHIRARAIVTYRSAGSLG